MKSIIDFNSLIDNLPDLSKTCTNELNFQNINHFALQVIIHT